MSALFAQAPEEISNSTTWVWPCCAAMCNGVLSTLQKILLHTQFLKMKYQIVIDIFCLITNLRCSESGNEKYSDYF